MSVSPALPPSAPGALPVLGHLMAWRRDPLRLLTRAQAECGDVVSLSFRGLRCVLVSHPDDIARVHQESGGEFLKAQGGYVFPRAFGNGLLTSQGDVWRRQRSLAQPAFHRRRIAGYAATMVRLAEEAVAAWPDGATLDMHAQMSRLTQRIAGLTLFGVDTADWAAEASVALGVINRAVNTESRSLVIERLPPSVRTPNRRRADAAISRLDELVARMLESRSQDGESPDGGRRPGGGGQAGDGGRAGGGGQAGDSEWPGDAGRADHGARPGSDERLRDGERPGDLLAMLAEARGPDGTGMSPRQLRDEIVTLYLAGHETTASTLSWVWYFLATDEQAAEQVAAELAEVLGDRPASPGDLAALPFTRAVIDEAMRLYPPIWQGFRVAVRETAFGGYRVPAGTGVMMSQYLTQRDPRWFAGPLRFDPGRWLDGRTGGLPRYAYFPFGGGPRVCLGSAFALLEIMLVMATIARRVLLRRAGPPVRPAPYITLRPAGGIHVRISRI